MKPEPGEEVFFHGHPSWRSILSFYVRGLLIVLVAGVVAGLVTRLAANHVQAGWVSVAVVVAMAIVLLVGIFKRISTTYTITNQRLTIEQGIVSKDFHETRLERVQNVAARQRLLERLLRVGTVDFDTAASGNYDFTFVGVENPREVVRTVDRAIREHHSGARAAESP